jgi:hypothetical protein
VCSFAKLVFLVFLASFFLKFCRPFSNWSFDLVGAFKMVIYVQDFLLWSSFLVPKLWSPVARIFVRVFFLFFLFWVVVV